MVESYTIDALLHRRRYMTVGNGTETHLLVRRFC
jgi:hypothetical protein